MAARDQPTQGAHDIRLGGVVHGEIGTGPVADNSHAHKVLALPVDLPLRVLATPGAKRRRRQFGPRLAHFLFYIEFNGQAVAVPAGHVGGVEAVQGFGLDDDVLEHLVDRVADVEIAVGVRRAVVKNELRSPRARLADTLEQAHRLPLRQALRLAPGQIGFHRESGAGQIQGMFVIAH